jgi:hypothetical protein
LISSDVALCMIAVRGAPFYIKSGFPVAFSGSLHAVATGKLRLRVAPEMTGKMPVLLKQEIGRLESRAERGTAPRWKPSLPYRQPFRSFLRERVWENPAFLQKSGFSRIFSPVPGCLRVPGGLLSAPGIATAPNDRLDPTALTPRPSETISGGL